MRSSGAMMSNCWKSAQPIKMRCWPGSPLASGRAYRLVARLKDLIKRPDMPCGIVWAEYAADPQDACLFLRGADLVIAVQRRNQQVCRLLGITHTRAGHGAVGQQRYPAALEDIRGLPVEPTQR